MIVGEKGLKYKVWGLFLMNFVDRQDIQNVKFGVVSIYLSTDNLQGGAKPCDFSHLGILLRP